MHFHARSSPGRCISLFRQHVVLLYGHNQHACLGRPSPAVYASISGLGLESAVPRPESCHNFVLPLKRVPSHRPAGAALSRIEGLRPSSLLASCVGGTVSISDRHLVLVRMVCLATLEEWVPVGEAVGFAGRWGLPICVFENTIIYMALQCILSLTLFPSPSTTFLAHTI